MRCPKLSAAKHGINFPDPRSTDSAISKTKKYCCSFSYTLSACVWPSGSVLSTMPRQIVDLSPYLNAIRLKVAYRETYTDIAAWLLREHDVKITASWLQQKCRDLGVQAYQARTIDVQALTIIQQRFFYTFDNDEMISMILGNAGFDMKAKSVKQIRHQHGWLRRVASGADAEAEQLRVNASIEAAYEEGVVRQYGYRMMHTALRNRGVHAKRYTSSYLYGWN